MRETGWKIGRKKGESFFELEKESAGHDSVVRSGACEREVAQQELPWGNVSSQFREKTGNKFIQVSRHLEKGEKSDEAVPRPGINKLQLENQSGGRENRPRRGNKK